ncbi:hypothetical protein Tco_0222540 [Tanacetum coccineum]
MYQISILLNRNKITSRNLRHEICMAVVKKVLDLGYLLTEVTRDRALRTWKFDETAENMHSNFGSGYPGVWAHVIPTSRRALNVMEADKEDDESSSKGKRQGKLTNMGFSGMKRK